MDMLKITGLYKHFGDKEVLKGLDLTVPEGSIFGFIGKNNARLFSSKSCFMNIPVSLSLTYMRLVSKLSSNFFSTPKIKLQYLQKVILSNKNIL